MTTNAATPGGLEARPPANGRERTPAEIEADIERTRARLAGTVDAIADRVKPANVVRREPTPPRPSSSTARATCAPSASRCSRPSRAPWDSCSGAAPDKRAQVPPAGRGVTVPG